MLTSTLALYDFNIRSRSQIPKEYKVQRLLHLRDHPFVQGHPLCFYFYHIIVAGNADRDIDMHIYA